MKIDYYISFKNHTPFTGDGGAILSTQFNELFQKYIVGDL
jgi:hypothetical protein